MLRSNVGERTCELLCGWARLFATGHWLPLGVETLALFQQLDEYLRNTCKKALEDTASEFKKGNYGGLELAAEAMNAARALFDDEDTSFIFHLVASISESWLEEEASKEGGKSFLEELGDLLAKLAEAYGAKSSDKIDSLVRKFIMVLHRRMKQSPRLMAVQPPE